MSSLQRWPSLSNGHDVRLLYDGYLEVPGSSPGGGIGNLFFRDGPIGWEVVTFFRYTILDIQRSDKEQIIIKKGKRHRDQELGAVRQYISMRAHWLSTCPLS